MIVHCVCLTQPLFSLCHLCRLRLCAQVLFGNKGAGMFNHKDTLRTASFHLTLHGTKRWHICAPSEEHKMCVSCMVEPSLTARGKHVWSC